jgi:hypothetical protein
MTSKQWSDMLDDFGWGRSMGGIVASMAMVNCSSVWQYSASGIKPERVARGYCDVGKSAAANLKDKYFYVWPSHCHVFQILIVQIKETTIIEFNSSQVTK